MAKYVFDRKKGAFRPKFSNVWSVLSVVFEYLFVSLLVAVVFYAVFVLAFSTDREKTLERENAMLEAEYASLCRQLDLIEGTVGDLRVRDRAIYRDLFSADPSNYIIEAQDTLFTSTGELEGMLEDDLVWDTYARTKRMESAARQVSEWLALIDTALVQGADAPTSIPSVVPVKDFSPLQTGASVGRKINPFYKTVREHTGLDIVAPSGTTVLCSADGRVSKVVHNEKGMGNQVVVDHPGGFQTIYSHLAQTGVSAGQAVRQGAPLGKVGQTGSCFAPCLHYEVLRGGFHQDPVNYFFGELSPATYHEMMIVALTTGQSLD